MAFLFRGKPREPEFVVPPAEASVAQHLADLRSRVDAALRVIDRHAAGDDPDVRDAVLDVRHELRRAVVPVDLGGAP